MIMPLSVNNDIHGIIKLQFESRNVELKLVWLKKKPSLRTPPWASLRVFIRPRPLLQTFGDDDRSTGKRHHQRRRLVLPRPGRQSERQPRRFRLFARPLGRLGVRVSHQFQVPPTLRCAFSHPAIHSLVGFCFRLQLFRFDNGQLLPPSFGHVQHADPIGAGNVADILIDAA